MSEPKTYRLSEATVAQMVKDQKLNKQQTLELVQDLIARGVEIVREQEQAQVGPPASLADTSDWIVRPTYEGTRTINPGLSRNQLMAGKNVFVDSSGNIRTGDPNDIPYVERAAEALPQMGKGIVKSAVEVLNKLRGPERKLSVPVPDWMQKLGIPASAGQLDVGGPLLNVDTQAETGMEEVGKALEQMGEYYITPGGRSIAQALTKSPFWGRVLATGTEMAKSGEQAYLHGAEAPGIASAAALGALPGYSGGMPERTQEKAVERFVRSIGPVEEKSLDSVMEAVPHILQEGLPVGPGKNVKMWGSTRSRKASSEKALEWLSREEARVASTPGASDISELKAAIAEAKDKAIGSKIERGPIPDDQIPTLEKSKNRLYNSIVKRPEGMDNNAWRAEKQRLTAQADARWESYLQRRYGITPDEYDFSLNSLKFRLKNPNNPEYLAALEDLEKVVKAREKLYAKMYGQGMVSTADLNEWKKALRQIAREKGGYENVGTMTSQVGRASRTVGEGIHGIMPGGIKDVDALYKTVKTANEAIHSAFHKELTKSDGEHFTKYIVGRMVTGMAIGGMTGAGVSDINPLYGVAAGAVLAGITSGRAFQSMSAQARWNFANAVKKGHLDAAYSILLSAMRNSPELSQIMQEGLREPQGPTPDFKLPLSKRASDLQSQVLAMPER